jgi:hypothetical protein
MGSIARDLAREGIPTAGRTAGSKWNQRRIAEKLANVA